MSIHFLVIKSKGYDDLNFPERLNTLLTILPRHFL
ncbi:MAG: hypothetical protein CM1200mP18_17130 [Gammaproteobacteria bacterium]|nr:MAG: hypothetical protein CM1200mP18_17130 [Gammaproteobacteria bacterium]